jgi:hypothetical protein
VKSGHHLGVVMERFPTFFKRILQWLKAFPVSLFIGIFLGILGTLLLAQSSAFIFGIVLGVILEQLLLGVKGVVDQWRKTHPIRQLLGTIADDNEAWIFFSSLFRDLSKPEEYKLTRTKQIESDKDVLITGPSQVLGEGDALSLALIQILLARGNIHPNKVHVERAEKEIEHWGLGCFCIGAHNAKSRVILEKYENPFFTFDNNYTVITQSNYEPANRTEDGEEIRRGVYIEQSEDTEPTDYGIILKFMDQFHPGKKTIFIIAGIGPAGTSGAANFLLTNCTELSKLGDEFGVLVQVPSGFESARLVEFDKVAQFYVPMKDE